MKVTKIAMTLLAGASLLALTPAAFAQTNTPSTNAPSGGRNRSMNVDTQLQRIDKAVTLTDAQKPKVKAILEEQMKEMQKLQGVAAEDRRAKMIDIRAGTAKKLKEILTAEQYQKYEAMPVPGRNRNRSTEGGAGSTPPAGQ